MNTARLAGLVALSILCLVRDACASDLKIEKARLQHSSVKRAGGLINIETAAGTITVAASIADRMKGFIADVVERGFKGRVHCYSWAKSHVRHSLHHTGEACDFAQHWTVGGHIRTHGAMRHVADLAAKWGLRDGCSFRDCGHVDGGLKLKTAFVARQRSSKPRAVPGLKSARMMYAGPGSEASP
jgi:hypothetical protein